MTSTDQTQVADTDITPHIVVGVDGSPDGEAALRWAAAQAARSHLGLEVVTAFGPEHQYVDEHEALGYMAELTRRAIGIAREVAPEVVVTHGEHLGTPRSVLVAESDGADLLVVGSRGLGGFSGLLLGSVSRRCVHGSSCPVVVVRAPDGASGPGEVEVGQRRIVVGVDGSASSDAALSWAAHQAEATGTRLEAITTWDWVQNYGWGFVTPPTLDLHADAQKILDTALEPVRKAFPSIAIDSVVIEGPAAECLVKATVGADLVVVGSRGHSALVGALIGSVSEYCVTHARCPVVVMHRPGDGADD